MNAARTPAASLLRVIGRLPALFLSAAALCAGSAAFAASASVNAGQAVALSVGAQGTAPFNYQWYKNGSAISGATGASYALASATINDSGSYSALVRNAAGSTLSDIAALTVNAIVIPPPVPPPTPVPTTINDSGFESIRVGTNTFSAYLYSPTIANWTFLGYSGITGNNSGFTSGNPGCPEGTQVAFVQMQGSATARVTLSSGRYVVSAMVANRVNWGGLQTVLVFVDGAQVGRFSGGSAYTLATTTPFSVPDGVHDIRFAGQTTTDCTLFMDQIKIAAAPSGIAVGSSGFEAPDAGANDFWAFRYNPPTVPGTQDWVFQGYSGVTGNKSGFTASNPDALEGRQVAFIQMDNSVMSQTLSVPNAGSYQLTLLAAQRGNYNQANQLVQIYLDGVYVGTILPQSTTYQSFTFPFSTTAGSHQLMFRGTVPTDSTVFLDRITIQQPGT